MTQHDYVIANAVGSAIRADMNDALAAIVSQNSGATAPATTYAYMWWADTTTGYLKQRNGANAAWNIVAKLDQDMIAVAQAQAFTAFTSTGTAPSFTLTPTPAITAYAAGQRFRVKFHAAGAGSDTLNVSALGAKSIKQYDATGAKVAVTPAVNQLADVEYDGTDMVVLNPLPPVASPGIPVRQTVLSGPVDSSGLPNFGGSTGSTTVTMSGTLTVAAANGFGSSGSVDRVGQITNASWTGLSTNGTMYLFLDVASNGACTPGSGTLAPTYQWGGTYSTTNNQPTFNIQEMTMKVGNGSTASQAYRVFVGQVTVAAGVVSAITWYALMGRYVSADTATLPGAAVQISKSHNIGLIPQFAEIYVRCTTADLGYAVGDVIKPFGQGSAAADYSGLNLLVSALTVGLTTGDYSVSFAARNKSTGARSGLTAASWSYFLTANRGW